MNTIFKEVYKRKLTSAEEAVKIIQDGWRVAVPVAVGQPPALINALARRKNEFTHLELFTVVDVYVTEMTQITREDPIKLDYSYCMVNRKGVQEGKYQYTPGRLGEVSFFPEFGRYQEAVMMQVCPMDEHGYFSMGLSCDYALPFARQAKKVLVQVNENMPRTFGRNFIHVSQVDAIVEENCNLAILPVIPSNENEKIVANYIAEMVDDGSCLQLGIGGIPNAAALAMQDKKDLGIHTEMITDSMRILCEKGIVTNRYKKVMPDMTVATFALGTQELYNWLNNNSSVHFYPTELVNDPAIIRKNDKVVSVNSTLQMDLTGQACSESIGPVQYTHVGGQADFILGAVRSRGGKSILAFESTADTKQGRVSRIVSHLTYGSFVSAARYDVQYVITEYGVAVLKYQTVGERVKRLIRIAHPDFRDQLKFEAKKANFI